MKLAKSAVVLATAPFLLGSVTAQDNVAAVDAATMERGAAIYARECQACHGDQGQGGGGVPLAGSGFLESTEYTVIQIARGGSFMPAFPSLTNSDLADVI